MNIPFLFLETALSEKDAKTLSDYIAKIAAPTPEVKPYAYAYERTDLPEEMREFYGPALHLKQLEVIPANWTQKRLYTRPDSSGDQGWKTSMALADGIKALQGENAELKAEVERLRKDEHRMDGLERGGIELRVQYEREEDDVFLAYKATGFPNDLEYTEIGRGVTVREAIDAALDKVNHE